MTNSQQPAQAFCKFYVTAAYSGLSPIMPGTAGTCIALGLASFGSYFFNEITNFLPWLFVTVFVALTGIWATNLALDWNIFARGPHTNPGKESHDPSQIVIDEVAGYFVSVLGLSIIGIGFSTQTLLLAFLFFRLFDMLKPGPIGWAEKLPRGYGIMADDILAGVAANLMVRFIAIFWNIG